MHTIGNADIKHNPIRFATFNASLTGNNSGELIRELATEKSIKAGAVAEIIRTVKPDILLINEFDYDSNGIAISYFITNYLLKESDGISPAQYQYRFQGTVNTGVQSGFDLDNNGTIGEPSDAYGFGKHPGQYGMVLLSKYPIEIADIRTFQKFLWKDMPGALLPDDPTTEKISDWYNESELNAFRLSSKSHWDIPVNINGKIVHVLASHPTPPVFDGPEDRNGRRNNDEIRFWIDYITPESGKYIYDDKGTFGGLAAGESFVIMGDLNADPCDGDSSGSAIKQLLRHSSVNSTPVPESRGAVEASNRQGGNNLKQKGKPSEDTADFGDYGKSSGNMRVDYVLPSHNLKILKAAVFWPEEKDDAFRLVGDGAEKSSDHRLVYVDVRINN
jgi:hypothetical protein